MDIHIDSCNPSVDCVHHLTPSWVNLYGTLACEIAKIGYITYILNLQNPICADRIGNQSGKCKSLYKVIRFIGQNLRTDSVKNAIP